MGNKVEQFSERLLLLFRQSARGIVSQLIPTVLFKDGQGDSWFKLGRIVLHGTSTHSHYLPTCDIPDSSISFLDGHYG